MRFAVVLAVSHAYAGPVHQAGPEPQMRAGTIHMSIGSDGHAFRERDEVSGRLDDQCGMGAPLWKQYTELHARERAKGCGGRYLATMQHAGLGDGMRGRAFQLELAMASGRALLVLDPSYPTLFDVAQVNWVPPEGCDWLAMEPLPKIKNDHYGQASSKDEVVLQVKQVAGAAPVVMMTQLGSWVMPRFGAEPPWAYLYEQLPGLQELCGMIKQHAGCAFHYLFKPNPALAKKVGELEGAMGLAPTDAPTAVHWRTGDRSMCGTALLVTAASEHSTGPSLNSHKSAGIGGGESPGIGAHGNADEWASYKALFSPTLASIHPCASAGGLSCAGGSAPVLFFSDNMEAKQAATRDGYRTTDVTPAHVGDGGGCAGPSDDDMLGTLAELLLMAKARVFVSIGYHSSFVVLAAELASLARPVRELMVFVDETSVKMCDITECRQLMGIDQCTGDWHADAASSVCTANLDLQKGAVRPRVLAPARPHLHLQTVVVAGELELWSSDPAVYVTLTTITDRLPTEWFMKTLKTLMDLEGDHHVVLNVPVAIPAIPVAIQALAERDPRLLVHRCDEFGPVTKLVASLLNDAIPADALLVVVDDDMIYKPKLLLALLAEHRRRPNDVVCMCNPSLEGFKGYAVTKAVAAPIVQLLRPRECYRVDDDYLKACVRKLGIATAAADYPGSERVRPLYACSVEWEASGRHPPWTELGEDEKDGTRNRERRECLDAMGHAED